MTKRWSNLAKVVYKRTYAREDNGKLENWKDTVERIIRGNVKDHKVSEKEIERLRYFITERKAMPAGRGLWFSGAPAHAHLGGESLINPLHEDTKVLTKEHGWVAIGELEDKEVTLLSSTKLYGRDHIPGPSNAKWVTGTVSSFEKHPCMEITYEDKHGISTTVIASMNHRWFTRNTTKDNWKRISTEELKEGMHLPKVTLSKNYNLSEEGAKHGFFFGDGSRRNGELRQFGTENVEVLRKLFHKDRFLSNYDDKAAVNNCPLAWGKLPEGSYKEDAKYKFGFLAGYFAAGGRMRKSNGEMRLHSSRLEELKAVTMMFKELGVGVTEPRLDSTSSNYKEERELYCINISPSDLTESFFLKEEHRKLWKEKGRQKRNHLKITKLKAAGTHKVLCATVPEYEQFVIDGWCLTSNCWFTTSKEWNNFVMAQDLLMLGGGVGLSVEHKFTSKLPKIKEGVEIFHKNTTDADFIVPDSREGWCELTRKVLESFFETGKSFSYSTVCIRGAGEAIKGFGGKSSGPIPLIKCVEKLCGILIAREGKQPKPLDAADIICTIGEMVVAGNVRRSAIIILGDAWDKEYLRAKRWDLKNVPTERAMANFSIVCDDIEDVHSSFWKTYEHGEPFGIINRTNMQRYGRMGERKKDTAIGMNPCVTGNTEILTPDGYYRIDEVLDRPIEVWNGFEWSEVTPKITGHNRQILKVTLSNGMTLDCTENHKFVIAQGYSGKSERVEAKDLESGMKLIKHDYPVIEHGKEVEYAYTQGFISAEGMDGYNYFWIYEPKMMCKDRLSIKRYRKDNNQKRIAAFQDFDAHPKNLVPFHWNLKSRLDWLAGLFDGDGCELKEGGLQLVSIDKEFLINLQKLLTTVGVASKIVPANREGERMMPDGYGGLKEFNCKETNRICIGAVQMQHLKRLGLKCERLSFDKKPQRDASRFITVVDITESHVADTVYCFTEPKRNMGCFNGIVTGQCAEACLEDGEPCNLQELFLSNMSNKEELKEAAKLMHRWGKRITCESYHHTKSAEVIARNRRIGTGITGCLQSSLFVPEVLDEVYAAIQNENEKYSKKLGIPESIRTTVVKPSGTLSLLGDCTPGIHPAYSKFYIRRVRFAANDKLIPLLKAAGHPMEPVKKFDGTIDHGTLVVDFYMQTPDGTPTADQDFDTWKQLNVLKMAQKHWADQAVSVTVYYKKQEIPELKQWLSKNLKYLKSISFLCHSDHGFDQAPLEGINEIDYEKNIKKIKTLDVDSIQSGEDLENLECAEGFCPVK
jgi:ribonucleotide reductase alpha subunit